MAIPATSEPSALVAKGSAVGTRQIILFDGVCNLCNGFVQFVIKRDKHGRFQFGALQSQAARTLLKDSQVAPQALSSVVYLKGDRMYVRSAAALHVLRDIGGLWPLAYVFMLVPRPVRDRVYDWVARNRYKWFGKRDVCMIPEGGSELPGAQIHQGAEHADWVI